MAISTWPSSLPQKPLMNGFSDALAVNVISTPMDKGPAKTRRLGAKRVPMPVSFPVTKTQVATLETFVTDTLLGVRRFNFTHPRTGTASEICIIPDGDGKFFTITPLGGIWWQVSMLMLVMP